MYQDSQRQGFGEQGRAVDLSDSNDIMENEELFQTYGMSVLISNKISVNRSIPDYRDERCLDKLYTKNLPQVSIIIIFYNEVFSVFKRTLHSLYNRTPHELIKEVILVNDKSTLDYLYEPLRTYIMENFPKLNFKILNLKKKHGAMKSRIAGAKVATGKILFVMEPHVELGYNWLPPLIDAIATNPKTVVVPVIDIIENDKLQHTANMPSRGVFDWSLYFQLIKRLPVEKDKELNPFETPVMNGGIFCIHKDYFFELGPYEEKTILWGAEGIEMSLKIWLCGGRLLEVPCSRVSHLYRKFNRDRKHENITDFEGFNQKILIEVWFEDYKKYVLSRNAWRYENIDVGDLTEAKLYKKLHNCKPFEYFLETVAPDLVQKYPPIEYIFSSGTVKLLNSSLCWDASELQVGDQLKLSDCDKNLASSKPSQYYEFTFFRDIRHRQTESCVDTSDVSLQKCHEMLGNQNFQYNKNTNQIINAGSEQCIEANVNDNYLCMNTCDSDNILQKWQWGFVNDSLIDKFELLAKRINY